MSEQLVAGVDCSTQSTKVLVVDASSGDVVGQGRSTHEVTGTGGARETDPEVWWRALADALAQTGCADRVAAISIAGQQHGLVTLDDRGRPLRPAMLWNDTRSADQASALRDDLGGPAAWAERVGVVPVASFTVSKWAWLRETEPHVAEATAAIRLPHDHLTERLTGVGTTDRGDASGTGWWSTASQDYTKEVLDLDRVRLDPGVLPRVVGPVDVAGEVTGTAAEALGLPPGAVVAPGTGDNMSAALGLGLEPGTPVVSLGTSGTAYTRSTRRTIDPSGTVAGFADATGHFLPLAATLNCTLAVDRFATLLGLDREDVAEDAGGVVVLPYLDGERTPDLPLAAGSVVGLRHDTTGPMVLRAAYEGAAASLLDSIAAIRETGASVDDEAPLVLIGGGARGTAWRTVIRRLSGRPVQVPARTQLVALGAAVQAAAVLGGEDPVAVAARWDTRGGEVLPALPRADDRWDRLRAVREDLQGLNRRG